LAQLGQTIASNRLILESKPDQLNEQEKKDLIGRIEELERNSETLIRALHKNQRDYAKSIQEELDNHLQERRRLEKQIIDLQEERISADQRLKESKEQVLGAVSAHILELENAIETITNERDSKLRQINELEDQLRMRNKDLERQMTDNQDRLQNITREKEEVDQRLRDINANLVAEKERTTQQTEIITALNLDLENSLGRVSALTAEIDRINAANQEILTEQQTSTRIMLESVNQQLRDALDDLQDSISMAEQLNQQHANNKTEKGKLQKIIDDLNKEVESLRISKEELESRIIILGEEVLRQIDNEKVQIQDMADKLAITTKTIVRMESELLESTTEKTTAVSRVEELTAEKTELEAQKSEMEAKFTKKLTSLTETIDHQSMINQKQLSDLQTELTQLRTNNQGLETLLESERLKLAAQNNVNKRKNIQISSYKDKITELEEIKKKQEELIDRTVGFMQKHERLQNLLKDEHESTIEKMRGQLDIQDKEKQLIASRLENVSAELEQHKVQLATARQKGINNSQTKARLEQEIETLGLISLEEKKHLQSQLETLTKTITDLNAQIKESEDNAAEILRYESDDFQTRRLQLLKDMDQLRQEKESTEQAFETVSQTLTIKNKQFDDLQQELELISSGRNSNRELLRQKTSELTLIKSELEKIRKDQVEAKTKVKNFDQLSTEMERLTEQLQLEEKSKKILLASITTEMITRTIENFKKTKNLPLYLTNIEANKTYLNSIGVSDHDFLSILQPLENELITDPNFLAARQKAIQELEAKLAAASSHPSHNQNTPPNTFGGKLELWQTRSEGRKRPLTPADLESIKKSILGLKNKNETVIYDTLTGLISRNPELFQDAFRELNSKVATTENASKIMQTFLTEKERRYPHPHIVP
jgi:chromosome segregation ATPase